MFLASFVSRQQTFFAAKSLRDHTHTHTQPGLTLTLKKFSTTFLCFCKRKFPILSENNCQRKVKDQIHEPNSAAILETSAGGPWVSSGFGRWVRV